jgi:hypothetical protein
MQGEDMKAPHWARLAFVAAAVQLAALFAVACGGGRQFADAPQLSVEAPAELAGALPDLASLDPARGAAYTLDDISHTGADYETLLPSAGITVAGDSLDFASPGGPGPAGMAFALYGFNLEGYDREPLLEYAWSNAPGDNANVYRRLATGRRGSGNSSSRTAPERCC